MPDRLRRRDAVEDRQIEIHRDQVGTFAAGDVHRFLSVACFQHRCSRDLPNLSSRALAYRRNLRRPLSSGFFIDPSFQPRDSSAQRKRRIVIRWRSRSRETSLVQWTLNLTTTAPRDERRNDFCRDCLAPLCTVLTRGFSGAYRVAYWAASSKLKTALRLGVANKAISLQTTGEIFSRHSTSLPLFVAPLSLTQVLWRNSVYRSAQGNGNARLYCLG